jgi:cation/acetate symporter
VQFIKGSLLIIFSTALVVAVLIQGFKTKPDQNGNVPFHDYQALEAVEIDGVFTPVDTAYSLVEQQEVKGISYPFVKLTKDGVETWWQVVLKEDGLLLNETQSVVTRSNGEKWVNGALESKTNQLRQVGNIEEIDGNNNVIQSKVSPVRFLAILSDKDTLVRIWKSTSLTDTEGSKTTIYYSEITPGNKLMRPGVKFKVQGTFLERMDFLSLMIALFLGTAALPHILIRYYTVPSPASARKSTIVAIAAIGFFYILTLFMGFGAMINGVLNPMDSNMAAPLLARSFGTLLFAIISAIAFATVLGTVSGLIVAASGAVAHDLMDRLFKLRMDDHQKVLAGKISAFVVGALAIVLGILFKGMNVSFLVGLAFAVAASANLPSIIMMLFWKKTTAKGITASILTGILTSLGLIALSPDLYKLYGLNPVDAPIPFSNPGIISIPLSFIVLVVVSLMTQKKKPQAG